MASSAGLRSDRGTCLLTAASVFFLSFAQISAHASDSQPVDVQAETSATGAFSIAALHSDIKFSLLSGTRKQVEPAIDAFESQLRRIVDGLQSASSALYPQVLARIGAFDVFVAESTELSASSSATGRIALNAAFASVKPTDDWLALVVAREMAHVIAGHHDNNSTASIVTSFVMNLIIPGSGLVKSVLSLVGSQLAGLSGRERQVGEADEIALKLLGAAGYADKALALNLAVGPPDVTLAETQWGRFFAQSSRALLARVRGAPVASSPAQLEDSPQVAPILASTDAHLRLLARDAGARIAPDEIVVRARPSGMPGGFMFNGRSVPGRRIE